MYITDCSFTDELRHAMCYIFFLKLKTAYEMRISDWSSDVCASDLLCVGDDQWTVAHDDDLGRRLRLSSGLHPLMASRRARRRPGAGARARRAFVPAGSAHALARGSAGRRGRLPRCAPDPPRSARNSVVWGKRVAVRVDTRGRALY